MSPTGAHLVDGADKAVRVPPLSEDRGIDKRAKDARRGHPDEAMQTDGTGQVRTAVTIRTLADTFSDLSSGTFILTTSRVGVPHRGST